MILYFCGKTNRKKIEKKNNPRNCLKNTLYRLLIFLWRHHVSSWSPNPVVILLEVSKLMNTLNSDCLNDMKSKKTITFGLRNIAYLSAKLWNDNVCNFSDAQETDFATLKTSIDSPSVLLVYGSDFPYLWYFHQNNLCQLHCGRTLSLGNAICCTNDLK